MSLKASTKSLGPAVSGLLILLFLHCGYRSSKIPAITTSPEVSAAKPDTLEPWDEPPQPVGGFEKIQRNLFYPEFARKDGIEGKVIVYAVITEDGKVADMKIIQSLGSGCDEEAMRAIKSVSWKPAKQKAKPVRAVISVPIFFRLQKIYKNY